MSNTNALLNLNNHQFWIKVFLKELILNFKFNYLCFENKKLNIVIKSERSLDFTPWAAWCCFRRCNCFWSSGDGDWFSAGYAEECVDGGNTISWSPVAGGVGVGFTTGLDFVVEQNEFSKI